MDPGRLFPLQLLLSFLVGGLWILATTLIAERLNPRLGGLAGGLPSTSAVTFLFLGWARGPGELDRALSAFPLTFSVNAAFLGIFALVAPRRGAAVGLATGLGAWLLLQLAVFAVSPLPSAVALGVWAGVLAAAVLIFSGPTASRCGRPQMEARKGALAARAALSGTVVALAVLFGEIGGPVAGSVFAAFPAVYLMTLAIISRSSGVPCALEVVGPLLISGEINCVLFAVLMRAVLPLAGVAVAAAAGYAGVALLATACIPCLRRLLRAAD
ncbi:MAG TPA: hypothetical protein PK636_02580 [bacterium]|nr:hypothetical protein [bacterium]HPJ71550.1 hypothetical protein [bacterium]HPQ65838.1 hypothetical protein [bacterium]